MTRRFDETAPRRNGRIPIDERLAAGRGRRRRSTKERPSGALRVVLHELTHLIDGLDAVEIRLLLRLAPREQSMPAEHDPVAARRRLDRLLQHQRQLESRALPRHPGDAPAILLVEFVELLLAVGARGERNRPVRVQMIDVWKRQKRVERRVDRRGDTILAERAERIVADHLVFMRLAAIAADEIVQFVHVEHGETRRADRGEVAAAALDRHDATRLAGQRIGQIELRARVSAAEVRDAKIGAEQVRTITKELERLGVERRRLAGVPEILQEGRIERGRFRHKWAPGIRENVDSARPRPQARRARSARRGTNVR